MAEKQGLYKEALEEAFPGITSKEIGQAEELYREAEGDPDKMEKLNRFMTELEERYS